MLKVKKRSYRERYELYRELDQRQNYLWNFHDGLDRRIVTKSAGNGLKLHQIEKFVENISRGTPPTFGQYFSRKGERNRSVLLQLRNNFDCLNMFSTIYSAHYLYSPYVQVFIESFDSMNIKHEDFLDPFKFTRQVYAFDKLSIPCHLWQWKIYDRLVDLIHDKLASSPIKTNLRLRRDNAQNDYDRTITYIDDCFESCSTLFVQRVDLGYQYSLPFNSTDEELNISRERIKRDFGLMTKKFSTDPTFQDLVGHLAKLEFGKDKGYFIHIAVLFDGREEKEDGYWANLIGEYWSRLIVQGDGIYHNCNIEKDDGDPEKYTGTISEGSTNKRRAFELRVVSYITKSSRYLKAKVKPRERVFFKGNHPLKKWP